MREELVTSVVTAILGFIIALLGVVVWWLWGRTPKQPVYIYHIDPEEEARREGDRKFGPFLIAIGAVFCLGGILSAVYYWNRM